MPTRENLWSMTGGLSVSYRKDEFTPFRVTNNRDVARKKVDDIFDIQIKYGQFYRAQSLGFSSAFNYCYTNVVSLLTGSLIGSPYHPNVISGFISKLPLRSGEITI